MSGLYPLLNSFGLSYEILIRLTFYAMAAFTILAALFVVLSRNLFHSALGLALTLIGVACIYLYLDAEFLALVQILIYVGAIVTLFLFTIMLTADIHKKMPLAFNLRTANMAMGCLILFGILAKVFSSSPWQEASANPAPLELKTLGYSLMTNYVLPFEIISVLSLAALVGAVIIGKADKK